MVNLWISFLGNFFPIVFIPGKKELIQRALKQWHPYALLIYPWFYSWITLHYVFPSCNWNLFGIQDEVRLLTNVFLRVKFPPKWFISYLSTKLSPWSCGGASFHAIKCIKFILKIYFGALCPVPWSAGLFLISCHSL